MSKMRGTFFNMKFAHYFGGYKKLQLPNRKLYNQLISHKYYSSQPKREFKVTWKSKYVIPLAMAGAAGAGVLFGNSLRKREGLFRTCEASPKLNPRSSDQTNIIRDTNTNTERLSLDEAIEKSKDLVQIIKDETGSPGVAVAVSVDGKIVWTDGIGYSDIENRVICNSDAVMRIASISKSITTVIVGKLIEEGKLDVDVPISNYVSKDIWSEKSFNKEKVTITTRQLLGHVAGIRHYKKNCSKKQLGQENDKDEKNNKGKSKSMTNDNEESEMDLKEYYLKNHYSSVKSAVQLINEDQLCSKPGTEYLYTTHGYTLLSAVIEGASGKKFTALMEAMFKEMGLTSTHLDKNEPLIYNRSRYYIKSKKGRILNAPYVDCSYKWAGGGLLSTVNDIVKFGNIMLYSYQLKDGSEGLNGYLKHDTVKLLWTPIPPAKCDWDSDGGYGMGWGVVHAGQRHGMCRERRFYASHTGGAIGASSAFLVMPRPATKHSHQIPQGIVVAMIANMQSVGLHKTAMKIATIFDETDCD